MFRALRFAAAVALAFLALPAQAQNNGISFSQRVGVVVLPDYFGSSSTRLGPTGGTGLSNLRIGPLAFGEPEVPVPYAQGPALRGAFRLIPKRRGRDELQGMEDVKTSFEVGLRAHYAEEFWHVFADLRYGVIGHKAIAGEVGADALWRAPNGFILNAGPRAQFGNGRFNRTYFGVTAAEAAATGPALTEYTPSGGFHSVGFAIGGYQPFAEVWAVTGGVRYDRLRGDAARSPIVQQGSRNQWRAEVGLMRHFTIRF